MSIHKDNKGRYYVKYKKTTKRGFKTKKEANLYEASLRLNKNNNIVTPIKFHKLAEEFLDYYKKNVAYTSFDRTSRILKKYIIPNTKNKFIDTITELDCKSFYEYVYNLNLCTSYKNDIFNTYKRLFEYAIKFYNLNKNPAKIFDSFKSTRQEKLSKKNKDLNIWSNDEFLLFIDKVNNLSYKTLFIILYYTGIRLGEALALNWNDFKGDYIDINKNMPKLKKDGLLAIKEPKNISSIRKIKLSNSLINCLNNLKDKQSKKIGFCNNWYIFGGITPLSRTTINRIKDNAIQKSGVKRITIHEFRHSHASNLIANNVNIVSVSRRLGHNSVEMTLNVYTHLLSKTDEEMIDKIEECSQNVLK